MSPPGGPDYHDFAGHLPGGEQLAAAVDDVEEGFENEFLLEDAEVVDEAAGEAPAGQQGRVEVAQEGRVQGGGGRELLVHKLQQAERVCHKLEEGQVHKMREVVFEGPLSDEEQVEVGRIEGREVREKRLEGGRVALQVFELTVEADRIFFEHWTMAIKRECLIQVSSCKDRYIII